MNVTAGTTLDRLPVGSAHNQSQFYARGGKPARRANAMQGKDLNLGSYANSPVGFSRAKVGMKAHGGPISKL